MENLWGEQCLPEIVEEVVAENKHDHAPTKARRSLDAVPRTKDSPDDEGAKHTDGTGQEDRSPSQAIDKEGQCDSHYEGKRLEAAIDAKLILRIFNADRVHDEMEIVGHQAIT